MRPRIRADDERVIASSEAGAFAVRDNKTELKVELHQRLLDLINLSALDKMSREQIEAEVGDIVAEELAKQNHALNQAERKQLVADVLDELLGLGPLEPLLKDPTITDILVNGYNQVFVERFGVLEPTPGPVQGRKAPPADHPEDRLRRRSADRRILADGRCPAGRRKPGQCGRPAACDRRIAAVDPQVRRACRSAWTTGRDRQRSRRRWREVLQGDRRVRRNVLISGGTGSGKTTLLNAMSACIDDRERIVTIEDSAELQLQQDHVVRLETRPPNIEGKGEIAQRDLVKNALRMRPDRIIVGEVRAGEAFDMLQAMNTGHDGSMTTVHANTPRDALSRIEQMIGMSGIDIPPRSARAQIASAIHVVIQVARLSDGRRKLVSLSEMTGMEGDVITMQEIFRFRQTGLDADGQVRASSKRPGSGRGSWTRSRLTASICRRTCSAQTRSSTNERGWLKALILGLRVRRGRAPCELWCAGSWARRVDARRSTCG